MASEVAGVAWVSKGPRPKKKRKSESDPLLFVSITASAQIVWGELWRKEYIIVCKRQRPPVMQEKKQRKLWMKVKDSWH